MAMFSGPMFEPAKSEYWESVYGKRGGHYNVFHSAREMVADGDAEGMEALRSVFVDGEPDEMKFVLFSTSGIHGTYRTIEEAEEKSRTGLDSFGEPTSYPPTVTFVVVQPRVVALRYGNCQPKTEEDFDFLKRLRQKSWDVVQEIGRHEEEA